MKNTINSKIIFWGILIASILFTSNIYAQSYLNSDLEWYSPWIFPWRAEILSESDKNKVNNFIDWVQFESRNEYMMTVNSRINILQSTLEARQINEYQLLRNINILWDIRDIIHERLEDLENIVWAPSFVLTLNWVTGSNSSVWINMSKQGKWYYVILPSSSSTPSIKQINDGQDSNWNSAIWWSLLLTGWLNILNLSWLSMNTSYSMYFTAKDFAGNQLNITNISFQTNSTPWTVFSSDLQISSITDSWAIATINLNTPWTGYYVILPSSSAIPTVSQIRNWQDSLGVYSKSWNWNIVTWTNQFNLTWLSPNTGYVVYYVIQNNSWTYSNIWSSLFQTTVGSAWLMTSFITSTSITLNINSTVAQTWYYVVLPWWSVVPSVSQIKNGQNSIWISTKSWIWNIVAWNNQTVITWLTSNTNYVLFFVTQDQLYPQNFTFTTSF